MEQDDPEQGSQAADAELHQDVSPPGVAGSPDGSGAAGSQRGLEAALDETAGRVAIAIRAAGAVTGDLRKSSVAARTGSVRELRRALDTAVDDAGALLATVRQARDQFTFDETAHMASGAYAAELLAAARTAQLAVFSEDDQLAAYPSLIRVLPTEAALQIDRRRERQLRPSVVVASLKAAQDRPPRFRAQVFLDSLAGAYELLAAPEEKADPVIRFDAVWGVLTLLPGQSKDYSRPEFARDLYLLDQSRVTTTRGGRGLRWHASTGTKGAGVLTTVARTGQQQRYWGVSFTPAP